MYLREVFKYYPSLKQVCVPKKAGLPSFLRNTNFKSREKDHEVHQSVPNHPSPGDSPCYHPCPYLSLSGARTGIDCGRKPPGA